MGQDAEVPSLWRVLGEQTIPYRDHTENDRGEEATWTMTIEVERGGQWVHLNPEALTIDELCWCLDAIQIEPDEFLSQKEINEGYAAIAEAVRRLQDMKQGSDA